MLNVTPVCALSILIQILAYINQLNFLLPEQDIKPFR